MPTNVQIPALGESVSEAVLIKWLKADGDTVAAAEPICELETDKANVDLPAPSAGVLRHVKEEGETVQIGETVARIDESTGAATTAAAPAKKPAAAVVASKPVAAPEKPGAPTPVPPPAPAARKQQQSQPRAEDLSPAVRHMVADNKLDATTIPGTGPSGRITKEDVQKRLDAGHAGNGENVSDDAEDDDQDEALPPPQPKPAAVQGPNAVPPAPVKPPVEKMTFDANGTKRVPMSKIRKRIADTLVRAQQTAAILTTFNEVDLSRVMEVRARHKERFEKIHGVGLGFMSFFGRACALAIREFPRINAGIDGNDIIYHEHVHLGIAVSTDRGLAVPVLRNADTLSFAKFESEVKRLANATREGKLGLEELSGGTFTITNGGVFGSLLSTPIINPPQSAILGMHAIQKRAMVVDDKIEIRPMMYVALSYDHRLIDGKESVSFLVRMKEYLEDPARLMLEI